MTLQSALEAELPFLRAEAEARMTSRVTVRRKTGQWTQDEDTGEELQQWRVVYANLPFRLGGSGRSGGSSRTVRVGEEEYEQAFRTGSFPASTNDLADGDYIEVTAGENAGAVLTIVEAEWQDQATARRVPVVEASRPEEW